MCPASHLAWRAHGSIPVQEGRLEPTTPPHVPQYLCCPGGLAGAVRSVLGGAAALFGLRRWLRASKSPHGDFLPAHSVSEQSELPDQGGGTGQGALRSHPRGRRHRLLQASSCSLPVLWVQQRWAPLHVPPCPTLLPVQCCPMQPLFPPCCSRPPSTSGSCPPPLGPFGSPMWLCQCCVAWWVWVGEGVQQLFPPFCFPKKRRQQRGRDGVLLHGDKAMMHHQCGHTLGTRYCATCWSLKARMCPVGTAHLWQRGQSPRCSSSWVAALFFKRGDQRVPSETKHLLYLGTRKQGWPSCHCTLRGRAMAPSLPSGLGPCRGGRQGRGYRRGPTQLCLPPHSIACLLPAPLALCARRGRGRIPASPWGSSSQRRCFCWVKVSVGFVLSPAGDKWCSALRVCAGFGGLLRPGHVLRLLRSAVRLGSAVRHGSGGIWGICGIWGALWGCFFAPFHWDERRDGDAVMLLSLLTHPHLAPR